MRPIYSILHEVAKAATPHFFHPRGPPADPRCSGSDNRPLKLTAIQGFPCMDGTHKQRLSQDAPLRKPDTSNAESTRWRQLQIDWSGRQQLLRRWLVDDTHVKHLLRVLFDHTPSSETDCFLLIETIATEMSTSRRTAQRAVQQAINEQLLIVFGPASRRRCNTYRLRLANIFERARAEVKGDNLAHISSSEVTSAPPPPNRRAAAMAASHPSDEWAVVVEEMIAFGVGDPEPAAEKARQRGCSAPFVRRVIDYARNKVTGDGTRAWEGGALRRRIMNLLPGQAIDDDSLWLPPTDAYVSARRREAEQKERTRTVAKAEGQDLEFLQLEKDFGKLLNSLSAEDCDQLAKEEWPLPRDPNFIQYCKRGRNTRGIRAALLRQLARQSKVEQ